MGKLEFDTIYPTHFVLNATGMSAKSLRHALSRYELPLDAFKVREGREFFRFSAVDVMSLGIARLLVGANATVPDAVEMARSLIVSRVREKLAAYLRARAMGSGDGAVSFPLSVDVLKIILDGHLLVVSFADERPSWKIVDAREFRFPQAADVAIVIDLSKVAQRIVTALGKRQ